MNPHYSIEASDVKRYTDGNYRVEIFIHEAFTDHFAYAVGSSKQEAISRAWSIVTALHRRDVESGRDAAYPVRT